MTLVLHHPSLPFAEPTSRRTSAYGSVLNGHAVSADGILMFGHQKVALSAIKQFSPMLEKRRDIDSVLATVAVFMGAGAFLLLLVFEMGWRARFLVGATLFSAIAIAAIVDLMRTTSLDLYRLKIETDDGRALSFVTTNPRALDDMMTTIERATGIEPNLT